MRSGGWWRAAAAGGLRALLAAQLLLALLLLALGYGAAARVLALLTHMHKVTVYVLYGLIVGQAYSMKLQYTAGLRLLPRLVEAPRWPRASALASLWMISGVLIAANGLLVQAACKSTLEALLKELSSSLRVGISQYLTEPSWKVFLDTMQIELNCCGADKPSDWHEIPWLSVDFLDLDSDVVSQLAREDGKVLPPVTPYSCCSPAVLGACYHDPLQQLDSRGTWSGASLSSVGCARVAAERLTHAARALTALTWLVCLLQLVIVVLTQLLRTSGDTAGRGGRGRGRGETPLDIDSDDTKVGCLQRSRERAAADTLAAQLPLSLLIEVD